MYMIGNCAAGSTCSTAAANYTAPAAPLVGFQCGGVPATNGISSANLATQLASYLKSLPVDPLTPNPLVAPWTYETGYAITVATGNLITVTACYPEDSANVVSQSR